MLCAFPVAQVYRLRATGIRAAVSRSVIPPFLALTSTRRSTRTLCDNINPVAEREVSKVNVIRCDQPLQLICAAMQQSAVDPEKVVELTDSDSDDALPRIPRAVHHSPRRPTSNLKGPSPYNPLARQSPLPLNQFAFQANPPRVFPRFISSVVLQKEPQPSDTVPEKGNPSRGRKKARLVEINISESYISRLEKCVCCEIRWTTRKTTIQKLRHIQMCSKKHSHTSETVSVLIKKELNLPVETPAEVPTTLNTHLEDVVQSALPKKKSKKKKSGSTVCEYSGDTREMMLRRARAILGTAVKFDDESGETPGYPVSTQAVQSPSSRPSLTGDIGVGTSGLPPSPTWTFLPSKLKFQMQEDSSIKIPPSFPPNSDGNPSPHLGNVDINEQNISIDTSSGHSLLPFTNRPVVQPSKGLLSAGDKLPTRETPKTSSHFVKEDHHTNKSPRSLTSIAVDPQKRRRGRPPSRSSSQPLTKRKSQGRKTRMSAALEQWQEEFRTKIMQDLDLYRRILRFEPIHFDVFQNLAPPNGTRKLPRRRIVTFLDRQAINFYGYHMVRHNKRKRRSNHGLSSPRSKAP